MAVINSKDTKVSVSGFQVDKNVIYYGNTAINTNNISLISVSPIPASKLWIWGVLIVVGGLFSIENGGLLGVIVGIIWIIAVVIHNNNRGEYLTISLNSGNTLYFHCTDSKFMTKVVNLMVKCINTGTGEYSIRFDKCAIVPGSSGNIDIK